MRVHWDGESDDRPTVYVHAEARSDDPVRTFYEVPERIAHEVHACAVLDSEPFASCLLNIVLEREGALREVVRLKDHPAVIRERKRIVARLMEMARIVGPDEIAGTARTLERAATIIAAEGQ